MSKEVWKVALWLAGFLPLLLAIVAVNLYADPANLFQSGQYEVGIAQVLLSGKGVEGADNFDWRVLRRETISGLPVAPEVVVIGSSRAMAVDSSMVNSTSLRNDALMTATLEDYLALYELYRGSGKTPRRLILGVDPWIFKARHRGNYWVVLAPQYAAALQHLGLARGNFAWTRLGYELEKLSEVISPSYFQDSLARLWRRRGHLAQQPYTPKSAPTQGLRADGSQAIVEQPAEADKLRRDAINYVERAMLVDGLMVSELEPERRALFEAYLDRVQQDGVEVTLLLAPYHPAAYERLLASSRYSALAWMETYLREQAGRRGVKIVGSYDPHKAGAHELEFNDAIHAWPAVLRRILGKG